MLCNRCGSEVEAGAAECGNCGARLAGRKRSPRTLNTLRALEQRRQQAQSLDGSAEGLVDGIGDRFTTREIIGRGPTGVVYRAQDRHNDLTIALKVLHGELVADPDTTARALARSARLAHPNIVRLYDVGAEGGRVHLAMELLEGLTLRKVLELRREKRQRFGLAEVEPIVSQVVMALAHAHRHLAHGLLKPENIIILPDALKVTDFGLADALPREALVEAQRAAGVGAYLAPEFIKGAPVTPAVDLFALGALLYEMLTGRPYAPGAPTVAEATGLLSAGAAAIDAVIARATHADPTVRFADVERFSEALSGAVDVEGGLPDDDEATRRVVAPSSLRHDLDAEAEAMGVAETDPHLGASSAPPGQAPLGVAITAPSSAPPPGGPAGDAEDDLDAAIGALESSVAGLAAQAGTAPPTTPKPAQKAPAERRRTSPTPHVPPPPLAGNETADFGALAASTTQIQNTPTQAIRPQPGRGSWLLRSNVGFLLMVVLIVGGVLLAVLHFLRNRQPEPPPGPVVVAAPTNAPAVVTIPSGVQDAGAVVVRPIVDAAPPPPPPAPDAGATPVVPRPAPPEHHATAHPAPAPAPAPAHPAPERPAAPAATREAPTPEQPAAPPAEAPAPTPAPPAPTPVAPTPASLAPAPAPAPAPPAAEPTPAAPANADLSCPAGMILVTRTAFPKGAIRKGKVVTDAGRALARDGQAFCVDAYEQPGRGQKPRTRVSFEAARGLCQNAGRRLCTDDEWRRSCRGRGGSAYPYGKVFDPRQCNTEDDEGEERAVASAGSFKKCKSAVGAFDMSGNVSEWTADQTVRGGDFAAADEDAACDAGGRRAPATSSGSIGFRCCADLTETP